MRKIKYIFIATLLMAISFATTLGMQAYAASELSTSNGIVDFKEGEAMIRIQGNEGQSLSGKRLLLYRLFEAENSKGLESIDYTMNPAYEDALKTVVGSKITKDPANVTEYEVIDYLQSLNNYVVEGAHTPQELESRYSDYRYFMEELLAEMKAKQLSGESIYVNDTKADNSIEIKGLSYGYYLVEDVTMAEGTHSAVSLSMLGTANPESLMHIKADYPTVIKKIQEDDKRDEIGNDGWNDIADFEIGQDVPYKYESVIPNMNGYHTYYYAWHDIMDDALTLQEDSIQISISGQVQSTSKVYQLSRSEFNLIKGTSDATFVIEVADIKAIIDREFPNINEKNENIYGQKVIVSYKATLNEKAALNMGKPGFENDVRLEFSNNPNQIGKGKTGFTPWDTVVCFTYKIDGIKVNNYAAALEGAQFRLYSDEQCRKEVFVKRVSDAYYVINPDVWEENSLAEAATIISNAEGKFEICGLDSGTYYLKETEAPDGYRLLLDPIVITISPEYTTERNNYVKGEGAGNEIVKLHATAHVKTFLDGIYEEKDEILEANQEEGSINLSVVNEIGNKLPVTGSSMMAVLGAIGTLLMAIAWRRSQKKA